MTNELIEKGQRIDGESSNQERYIPYFEFLLFDPLYRKMSDKAKTMYTYLRNKLKYFKYQNDRYEQGEGTKSYLDEHGKTFVIADNVELCYIFNCSEPTLIKTKKELANYGLMEEVRRKNKANQIYPLQPKVLSDCWEHIEEIKEMRNSKKENNKRKQEAQKQGTNKHQIGNLKEVSSGNLKEVSSGNLKDLSKIESKNYKSNLINLNNKSKNLSMEENIKNTDLPPVIQTTLLKNRDRLIDSSLDLQDIDLTVNAFLENTPINTINYVLDTMLNNAKTSIRNFRNYFSKSLNNYYKNLQNKRETEKEKETNSNEVVPEWFKKRKEEKAKSRNKPGQTRQEPEITDDEFQKMLQDLRNNTGASQ